MDTAPSRPTISHPYPPSYHSSPSNGAMAQMPPSESYQYDYSKRHDSPSPNPGSLEGYGYSYGKINAASTGDLGSVPYGYPQRGAPYGPGAEMNRARSTSDPSLSKPSLSPAGLGGGGGVGGVNSEGLAYPPNWTEEDVRAEEEFMKTGLFEWKRMLDWRFWIRKKWWYWYIILVVCLVLTALMTIYHDEIVNWMKPAATWMKDLPAGYTIPVVVLFVLSFPPLFGHEIVSILVGIVWGLWVGFAIVAVGTFLGEVGNFYAFKYCLRSRAEKIERKNFSYACLAHVVREGGFFIIFVARLSAIPGHFTTAVFSTCGVGIWIFSIATILTLPKQLVVVYLGVLFGENKGHKTTKDRIISYVLVGVGFLMTVWAAWYIWRQMHKARIIVWRRKRMAEKGLGASAISAVEEGKEVLMPLEQQKQQPLKEFPGTSGDAEEDEEMRSPMIQKGRQAGYPSPYGQGYGYDQNPSSYEVDSQKGQNPFESADSLSQPAAFPSANPNYPGNAPSYHEQTDRPPPHTRQASGSYSSRKAVPPLDFSSARRDEVVMPVAKPAYHQSQASRDGPDGRSF